jgi:hypothetical protein
VIILATAIFWHALIPLAGTFISRHKWRSFRERFIYLCRKPCLDYAALRHNINGEYYFTGTLEAITDYNILWIKNDNLTVPVFLKTAQTYMLPLTEKKRGSGDKIYVDANDFDVNAAAPRRLNWSRISAFTPGAKVFIGGVLKIVNGQQTFISEKGLPLLVIFYECSERTLSAGVVRAGRYQNEYWNAVTPYSTVGGTFSLLWIAQFFFARPAYRTTVLSAIVAIFGPLFPLLPPGLIFTIIYRQLWWRACLYRVFRDIALLPLKYGASNNAVDNSPAYQCRLYENLPAGIKLPRLIPVDKPEKNEQWYTAGVSPDGNVQEPSNPFIACGLLPGRPKVISRIYNRKALLFEALAWFVLATGIALNVFFAELIIYFTQ